MFSMKTCKGCNKVLNNKSRSWCSTECQKKHYKPPEIKLLCQECGTSYIVRACRKNISKFCSHKCVGVSSMRNRLKSHVPKRVILSCEQCGKEYSKTPSMAGRSRFCSRRCQGIYTCSKRTGSNNPNYKSGIKSFRERAIECFGEKCRICKSVFDIEIHHINADRSNNELDNLVPLCVSCHQMVHKVANKGFKFITFLDECPSDDIYHAYVLPLIHSKLAKHKSRQSKEN